MITPNSLRFTKNKEEGQKMASETITILLSQFNQMCKEIEELRAYKKEHEEKADKDDKDKELIEEVER